MACFFSILCGLQATYICPAQERASPPLILARNPGCERIAVDGAEAELDDVHVADVTVTRLLRTGRRGVEGVPAVAEEVADHGAHKEAAAQVALVIEVDGPVPGVARPALAREILVVQIEPGIDAPNG